MNFDKALQILGIERYAERILNSNSHGEFIHIPQYIDLANTLIKYKKEYGDISWFSEWFDEMVKEAEKSWKRPESVFQHLEKILIENSIKA